MRFLLCCLIIMVIGNTMTAHSQTVSYIPLGRWVDPNVEALSRWHAALQTQVDGVPVVRSEARPYLAGLRPQSVELLTDALLRKHPKLLENNAAKARELILRRYRHNVAQLRGIMAEAVFLERHPEWGYVMKPNASQHDVFRWVYGRRSPFTGQIKYHVSGKPAQYAYDMRNDHRAMRFIVPDDHAEALKAYLEAEARRLEASGDTLGAKRAWRNSKRVLALGATSTEISTATREAAQTIAREKYATYTSLGASVVLSLGPTVYDWTRGDLSANRAAYHAAHILSLFGVNLGTDRFLQMVRQGALRGTVRGNMIVGIAITITESVWLLHTHGWQSALSQPDFYEQIVGSMSGLALALPGGTYAMGLAAPTGPWAPVIGVGVGILTGTVGYIGGKSITSMMIELFAPEMLHQQEKQHLVEAKLALDRMIDDLQNNARK